MPTLAFVEDLWRSYFPYFIVSINCDELYRDCTDVRFDERLTRNTFRLTQLVACRPLVALFNRAILSPVIHDRRSRRQLQEHNEEHAEFMVHTHLAFRAHQYGNIRSIIHVRWRRQVNGSLWIKLVVFRVLWTGNNTCLCSRKS